MLAIQLLVFFDVVGEVDLTPCQSPSSYMLLGVVFDAMISLLMAVTNHVACFYPTSVGKYLLVFEHCTGF